MERRRSQAGGIIKQGLWRLSGIRTSNSIPAHVVKLGRKRREIALRGSSRLYGTSCPGIAVYRWEC